ncbi:MAG: MgtC/SapB family protein [Chloroflexi bacterium]|nr:MgtC/SapB family protein [Chloroflexota bacterium]
MSNADQVDIYLRLLLALALGGLVGAEREYRAHDAGFRTSALVCVGAALFGEVSQVAGDSRIAAGVVQGIGFLGAGVMMQRGGNVIGATTAATMWFVAGLGLLVANDLWLTAVLAAATAVALLELEPVSDWLFRLGSGSRGGARETGIRGDEAGDPADDPG